MKLFKLMTSVSIISSISLVNSLASQETILESHEMAKKHTSHKEAPKYMREFIDLFKEGTINPQNFDEKVFNEPQFSNFYLMRLDSNVVMDDYIPMEQLIKLAPFIKQSGSNTEESIFKVFHEIETESPYTYMFDNKKKLFFILNHLLGNHETINIAKKYLEYSMNPGTYSSGAIFIYVLLDSDNIKDQQLALHYLGKIMDLSNVDAPSHLSPFIQQLAFIKDPTKAEPFLKWVLKKLPEYSRDQPYYIEQSLKFASFLFNHPTYHEDTLAFIEGIAKRSSIQNIEEKPLIFVIRALTSFPETQDYAVKLFETEVLHNNDLKAKDKWFSISKLLHKDHEKILQYLDKVWDMANDDEDRMSLLLSLMKHQDLKEFLYKKVYDYFDKILDTAKIQSQQQSFYQAGTILDSLVNFLSSFESTVLENIQDKVKNLINEILQFTLQETVQKYYLQTIQHPQNILSLIQKSGLNAEKILLPYSQSPTIDPHFFITLCNNMLERETFLLTVYSASQTISSLKVKILAELSGKITANPTVHPILTKEKISEALFNLLDTSKEFQEKIEIYDALMKFNDPIINKEILIKINKQFREEKIDQKLQLFLLIVRNTTIDKHDETIQEMFNALLAQAIDPYNALPLRIELVKELKNHSLESPHLTAYFIMLEQLDQLEETIKQQAFETGGIQGGLYMAHSNSIINKLKFIVESIQKQLHSYHFDSTPFDQNDVIQKTEELLSNQELMGKALGELGTQAEAYVNEAKENLKILKNVHVWNEPNSELSLTKINQETITAGQTYSLFLYYINNQKGKESYLTLVSGLVQALASTDAMAGCKNGAMSQFAISVFKEEFKSEEKEIRSLRDFVLRVPQQLTVLKNILIYLLSQHKPEVPAFDIHNKVPVFDIHNKILAGYFPDIEKNEFLVETFKIFNQTPLENIFGNKMNAIEQLFINLNNPEFNPSPEETKIFKDVYTLILNPAFLAFLAKDYSDLVVFTPILDSHAGDKLFFPDYIKTIEEYGGNALPYDPTFITDYLEGKPKRYG